MRLALIALLLLSACSGERQEGKQWCKTAKLCTCLYNKCEDVKY